MNTRGIVARGIQGSDPPPAPEPTREIRADPVRNALGGGSVVTLVPGGSDVCVIGHTLHPFCMRQ